MNNKSYNSQTTPATPATAERFNDAVVRDGLTIHWSEILGSGTGQVNEGEEVANVQTCQLTINPDYTHRPFKARSEAIKRLLLNT